MYLSCYTLDLRKSAVRRALRNSYEMHRTIMSAFEDIESNQPRKDMGILYRLYSFNRTHKLYVSSLRKPANKMPEGFIEASNSPKNISPVVDKFKENRVFCFDLMAMPSKKVKTVESLNSKRVFLGREVDRRVWLSEKAIQHGFEILSFVEENSIDNRIKQGGFKSVVFKGTLRIKDREKFIKAYKHGIGAEKAFGCGMLLLYNAL